MEPGHPEQKAQVVYLSHGGGLLPILGDPGHAAMVELMRRLGPRRTASRPAWTTSVASTTGCSSR